VPSPAKAEEWVPFQPKSQFVALPMDGDTAVSSAADAAAVSPPVENGIGPGLLSGRMTLLGNDQGEIVQASSDETCGSTVGSLTAHAHGSDVESFPAAQPWPRGNVGDSIPAVGDTSASHATVEVSTPNGGALGFDRKAWRSGQYASMGQSELQQSCRQIYGEVCIPCGMP
jgi:hypothetical protein